MSGRSNLLAVRSPAMTDIDRITVSAFKEPIPLCSPMLTLITFLRLWCPLPSALLCLAVPVPHRFQELLCLADPLSDCLSDQSAEVLCYRPSLPFVSHSASAPARALQGYSVYLLQGERFGKPRHVLSCRNAPAAAVNLGGTRSKSDMELKR